MCFQVTRGEDEAEVELGLCLEQSLTILLHWPEPMETKTHPMYFRFSLFFSCSVPTTHRIASPLSSLLQADYYRSDQWSDEDEDDSENDDETESYVLETRYPSPDFSQRTRASIATIDPGVVNHDLIIRLPSTLPTVSP